MKKKNKSNFKDFKICFHAYKNILLNYIIQTIKYKLIKFDNIIY